MHPSQVGPVQDAYSFTAADVEQAARLVEGFEVGEAQGLAVIRVDDTFVDYPVYHREKRLHESQAYMRQA